jgi:predicted RNase H-like HicB family nuclease
MLAPSAQIAVPMEFLLATTLMHNRAPAADRVLEFQFTVIFESLQAGGLPATIRAFSGLTMAGNTRADIRAAAKEAIRERLQILLELGQELPADLHPVRIESVIVNI